MMKAVKWLGIGVAGVLVLGVVVYGAQYIYDPGICWPKPGIAQKKIPPGVDTAVAFDNVTVLPMDDERVLEGQTVVVADGRITGIGPDGQVEIPAAAHTVDGEGRVLIPGLSDMIVHTDGSENDLLVYLANGVTTIRIMGEDPPAVLKWRDQIVAGKRAGPNIWVYWPQFEQNTFDDERGMERSTRGGKTYLHSPEEARQLVARMAAMGVDGIKAHAVVSSDVYRALLKSAAEHGLPFDGHAPIDLNRHYTDRACEGAECWNTFRAMGVPALTHVEELVKLADRSSDESIRQVAQDAADDGMWVTTSVALMRSIADQANDLEGTLASLPELRYVHPDIPDMRWAPGPNQYVDLGAQDWYPEYVAGIEKMLLALNESGARLMSGTDVPVPVMVPGFSLHDELETMVDVGLSPYEVLKTSTANPARYLGEGDEAGTIEVGKRADLVLLEANPLEDIANTREIAGVMVRGRYFDRANLDTILELVSKDYEKAATIQTIIEIAFPMIVVLLLVGVIWIVARSTRRRKANQVSS